MAEKLTVPILQDPDVLKEKLNKDEALDLMKINARRRETTSLISYNRNVVQSHHGSRVTTRSKHSKYERLSKRSSKSSHKEPIASMYNSKIEVRVNSHDQGTLSDKDKSESEFKAPMELIKGRQKFTFGGEANDKYFMQ